MLNTELNNKMLKWIIIIFLALCLIFLLKRIWLIFHSKRHAELIKVFYPIEDNIYLTATKVGKLMLPYERDLDSINKTIDEIDKHIENLDKLLARQFDERVTYLLNRQVEKHLMHLNAMRSNLMRLRGEVLLNQLKRE